MTSKDDKGILAEEYLEALLADQGDLGPKVGAMSEEGADERVRVEIAKVDGDLQKAGLWSINKVLKEHGVPPSVRLHLVSATVVLSLVAAERRASTS